MKQLTIILALFLVVAIGVIGAFMVDKSAAQKNGSSAGLNKDSLALAMHLTYHVKPERVTDFKKAFERISVETLKEPGCTAYALFQAYNDSTEFFLLEGWANADAHKKHMDTPHLKTYLNEVSGVFQEENPGKSEVVRILP